MQVRLAKLENSKPVCRNSYTPFAAPARGQFLLAGEE
eukprot:COSAG02_NODE_35787_length_463_cov_0.989011_1_plen_36_part_01